MGKIYNFLPIPQASRPENDAFLEISQSLADIESTNVLQVGAGWDGMFTDTTRPYALTATPLVVAWDVVMSDRFGVVLADPATDSMVYGVGVYSTIIAGTIQIPAPTGQVRTITLDLYDTVNAQVVFSGTVTVEKSVEQVTFNSSFIAPSVNLNPLVVRVSSADNFTVNLLGWRWQVTDVSPVGYVPASGVSAQERTLPITTAQLPNGFFGGMYRDVTSGFGPVQVVNGPAPVEGFDSLKAARSVDTVVLANASGIISSDGIWDVRFSLTGVIQLNARYMVFVWLNGARTECGAVIDPSNQTDEVSISSSVLFDLSVGDVLQLQIESSTGPSNYQLEFGAFTAMKVGERP